MLNAISISVSQPGRFLAAVTTFCFVTQMQCAEHLGPPTVSQFCSVTTSQAESSMFRTAISRVAVGDLPASFEARELAWFLVVLSEFDGATVLIPYQQGLEFSQAIRLAVAANLDPSDLEDVVTTGIFTGNDGIPSWKGQPKNLLIVPQLSRECLDLLPSIELSKSENCFLISNRFVELSKLDMAFEAQPFPCRDSRSGVLVTQWKDKVGSFAQYSTTSLFFRDITVLSGQGVFQFPWTTQKDSGQRWGFSESTIRAAGVVILDNRNLGSDKIEHVPIAELGYDVCR